MEKNGVRYSARILGVFFFVLAVVLPLACAPKPADRYSAQGMVISVEREAEGRSQVTILHEAIPDFKDHTGKVVGMEPMSMTFAADSSVRTENLQPQAKIKFVFEVHWDAAERLVLQEILPLDSETKLELNGYSVEMA